MARRRRREEDPEGPPPVLTFTDPRTGEVTTTEVVAPEPARAPRGPRRRWPLVVGGVGALLVAATVVGVLVLRDDPPTATPGGPPLAHAVTDRPALAWTRDLDGDAAVLGVGDHVLLSDGSSSGALVGLDREGRDDWTYDAHASSYVLDAGVDDIAVVVGDGVGAVSAEDGSELWWREAGDPVGVGDGAVLISGSGRLTRVDVRSGVETWSAEAESAVVGDEAVYVVTDGELQRLDLESGRVDWAVDVGSPDEFGLLAAANDEMVVVSGGFAVTAYSADDGAELWSQDGQRGTGGGLSVGVWSADRVYLAETSYREDGSTTGSEVVVRDRDGTVGRLSLAEDEDGFGFGGFGVRAGGQDWFVDFSAGALYDAQLQQVVDYPGVLTAVDDGVYAVDAGDLAYYPYGDTEPGWTLGIEVGDDAYLTAADDVLLVVDGGTLTAYR